MLRLKGSFIILITLVLMVLISIIPIRLVITLNQVPEPQAILVLGGNSGRIKSAAEFSKLHPKLEIWISDNRNQSALKRGIFQKAGIPEQRVHFDFSATDTVTNFTGMVKYFRAEEIRHLYLVTSDYHMARARAIATLVLGSRGIVITPVSIPSTVSQRESKLRIVRDSIRSLIWIATGRTGASFNPKLRT